MREIYSTASGMLLVSALVLTVNVHAESVVAPATDGANDRKCDDRGTGQGGAERQHRGHGG